MTHGLIIYSDYLVLFYVKIRMLGNLKVTTLNYGN